LGGSKSRLSLGKNAGPYPKNNQSKAKGEGMVEVVECLTASPGPEYSYFFFQIIYGKLKVLLGTCYPSSFRGLDLEDHKFRPAWAKSS
jgi:hypothetical protein